MKKFIKYGTIAGCILILAGVGVSTASLALGAEPLRIVDFIQARFQYEERRSEEALYEGYVSTERVEESWEETSAFGEMPIENADIFFSDDEVSLEASYPSVTDLDIYQRGGIAEIVYTSEEVFTVQASGMQLEQIRYDGTEHWQKLNIFIPEGAKCRLLIPDTWLLTDMDVEVTRGSFRGEAIKALSAEYKAMGGAIVVSQTGGTSLELKCENGMLNWTGLDELPAKTEASCRDGQIDISLPEGVSEEGFGYELESKGGELNLPRFSLRGEEERVIAGQAGMPYFELEAEGNGVINLILE